MHCSLSRGSNLLQCKEGLNYCHMSSNSECSLVSDLQENILVLLIIPPWSYEYYYFLSQVTEVILIPAC